MRPKRVLVLNDIWEDAASLALALRMQGYEAIPTADAGALDGLIRKFHPSALVLDVREPAGQGVRIVEDLKFRLNGPRTICLSPAAFSPLDVRYDLFDSVLVKPVDFGQLISAIDLEEVA